MSHAAGAARPTISAAVRMAVLLAALLLSLRWTAALTLPLIAALILFLLLSPVAEALQLRNVSGPAAAALVVFTPLLALTATALVAAPTALTWAKDVATALASFGRSLDPLAQHGGVTGAGARWLAQGVHSFDGGLGAFSGRQAVAFTLAAASTVMLTFFLLLAQRSLLAGLLRVVTCPRARLRLLQSLHAARSGVLNYLRVMTLMNVLLAAASGAVLWCLGIPNALAWAFAIALLLFIPYLGPLAITLLLLAAAPRGENSPLLAAAPALAFLVLHALEANLLSPWMMGHGMRVGRPALLVALIVGGWTWGVVGGVLAVPILIILRIALNASEGHGVVKAILEGEDEEAPSLASSGLGQPMEDVVGPVQPESLHSTSGDC